MEATPEKSSAKKKRKKQKKKKAHKKQREQQKQQKPLKQKRKKDKDKRREEAPAKRLKTHPGATPTPRHPFEVDPSDHVESDLRAYSDVVGVLLKIAARCGRPGGALRIWDPFYCDGHV